MMRLLIALLALVLLRADMYPDASNAKLPDAPAALLSNIHAATFFAKNYNGAVSGVSCTWDATHDVGDCINAAIAAAVANGGGRVLYPAGIYGLSTTIVNNTKLVSLGSAIGSGGGKHDVAPALTGGTVFNWIGAASGTMARVATVAGAGVSALTGAGVSNTTFNCAGTTTAGVGLEVVNVRQSDFANLVFNECSTVGLHPTVNIIGEVNGNTQNRFYNIQTKNTQQGNGAPGIQEDGDVTGNNNFNIWENINVFFKDGPGIRLVEADNEYFRGVKYFRAAGGVAPCAIEINQAYLINLGANSNYFTGVGGGAGAGNVSGVCAAGTGGTDGVSNTDTSYVSQMGAFVQADVGKGITGTNIPGGTTIASVVSPIRITLSAATTGTATGLSYTIAGRSPSYNNIVRDYFKPLGVDLPIIGTGATLPYFLDDGTIAGAKLTLGPGTISTMHKVQTADLTKTNDTTMAQLTGLKIFGLQAGKTYKCDGVIFGVSGAAGGFKITLSTDATLTASSQRFSSLSMNNALLVFDQVYSGLISGNYAARNDIFSSIRISGSLVVGAGGNLVVGGAQNTADPTPTVFYKGSTFGCVQVD